MTTKELIREKIDSFYAEYKAKFHQNGEPYNLGIIDGLDMAERILDTLPDESVTDCHDLEETANECKRTQTIANENANAGWSEEDEEMLNSCISSIEEAKENRYAYKETDGDTSYDHEIAWLKSLRNRVGKESLQPHWKPSEEQMKWLKDVIETVPMTCRQQVPLESLYNNLKKLM